MAVTGPLRTEQPVPPRWRRSDLEPLLPLDTDAERQNTGATQHAGVPLRLRTGMDSVSILA